MSAPSIDTAASTARRSPDRARRHATGTTSLAPIGWTIARHPSVWAVALRQAVRTVPSGWWRRPPFLPLPSREYLAFRLLTQYGDAQHPPDPLDVLNYLRWCRNWEREAA